ncbi:MAG: outer membrane protein transport protein [Deltaproteobacteria bacterium]|nr:outer membrane protein transport protein [Deltaproteobacteria bacterium]
MESVAMARWLVAVAALIGAGEATAGGFHVSVVGGRRDGMLANLASPDDVTAIFHNPAGLPDLGGPRLELFGAPAFLDNDFRLQALDPERFPEINPARCGEEGRDPCPWPVGSDGVYEATLEPESTFGVVPFLGFSTDLAFVSENLRNLAVGVAVYAPDFYGGAYGASGPASYFMTEGYFAVLATTAAVGWRVSERLALGFNVSYEYMRLSLGRRLSFVDALTEPGDAPSSVARAVQRTFGDALFEFTGQDHGAAWTVSVLWTPVPPISAALTLGFSSPAKLAGPLVLRPTREGVDSFDELAALGVDLPSGLVVEMPIPPAIGVGLRVVPVPWMELGLDARFWLYQLYGEQRVTPVYPPGSTGVRPLSAESLSQPKDDDVSFEIALGALFRPPGLAELELMVGAGFDLSPVPDETFSLDNPAPSTVLLSTGARWRIDEHWRVALGYIFMIYVPRDIRTSRLSPPANVAGGGYNHMPSVEIEVRF